MCATRAEPRTSFESLAKQLLVVHPEIPHEWRTVKSWLAPDRLDLICAAGAPNEVFASLLDYQIVVGDQADHTDFEAFGRDVTADHIGREAFDHFVALLVQHGHLDAAP